MPNGECRYYLTDQVDSVNVVLNDKGDAVTRTEYKPYGDTWVQEGDKSNRPKFNSQELDVETGYYFYNARYYEAEIGRFITADNIINGEYSTQGWNRFAYVKNNPVRYKDPSGHDSNSDKAYAMATSQSKLAEDRKQLEIINSNYQSKEKALGSMKKQFYYNPKSNDYVFEMNGVSLYVNASSWGRAKADGKDFESMMKKVSPETFKLLNDMTKDKKLNIASMQINCLWRPGGGSHTAGLGIDIGSIRSKDGDEVSYNESDYNSTDMNYRNKISNWLKDRTDVTQAYDPYEMRDGNYSRPNKWKDHIASYGYAVTTKSDNSSPLNNYNPIKDYLNGASGNTLDDVDKMRIALDEQHRHHLHIGVKKQ